MESPSHPRLLVVDDDRKLAGLIRDYLTPMGYEVEMRHNGPDGLAEALANPYAAVILDVMMPRKDGYTLCDELKNSDEYKSIVIVLLTAVTEAIKSTNYTHMGGKTTLADDFVPKPIDLDKLMEIVQDNL